MGRSYAGNRVDRNGMGMNQFNHATGEGRTSLVLVALPSENDPVQKISSEKAAHMTLLYLGEPDFDQTRINLITDFVEHAASTLSPFVLDVARRGVLGSDNADVLFFSKKQAKHVATFRDQILQNDLISEAYHSIEQYPEWTPHLTLGYPEAPAKKSPSDDSGIWYVNFDRISLWTGDSVGPTFRLVPHDNDMEVAMSQAQRGHAFITGVTFEVPGESPDSKHSGISHYGVKGMHWGVRRAESSGGGSGSASPMPKPRVSEDAKAVEKAFDKIDRGGTDALSNHELQSIVSRLNLEQQYSRLTSESAGKQTSQIERGHTVVKQMLGIGRTINDVHKFMKSPAGKFLKNGIKAAKFGAKVYTNPGGAALDLVRPKNHFTNTGR